MYLKLNGVEIRATNWLELGMKMNTIIPARESRLLKGWLGDLDAEFTGSIKYEIEVNPGRNLEIKIKKL